MNECKVTGRREIDEWMNGCTDGRNIWKTDGCTDTWIYEQAWMEGSKGAWSDQWKCGLLERWIKHWTAGWMDGSCRGRKPMIFVVRKNTICHSWGQSSERPPADCG